MIDSDIDEGIGAWDGATELFAAVCNMLTHTGCLKTGSGWKQLIRVQIVLAQNSY